MGGRLPSESLSAFRRNHWPLSVGIRNEQMHQLLGNTAHGLIVDAWLQA
jgi:hypothetical protein